MRNNLTQNLSSTSSEEIRDEMLSFMNEKYDKTFIGLSLERRGIDSSFDKLTCYADGENRNEDYAYVYRDINGNITEYSDTYFGVLIREEVESEIENICRTFGFDAKAFSDTLTQIYTNEFDKSKNLADLKLDKRQTGLLVKTALTSDAGVFSETDSQILFDALRKANFHGMFTLYYFSQTVFDPIKNTNNGKPLIPTNDDVIVYYYQSLD